MVCAYREPWTPSSHQSFSSQFRAATFTLALCLQRCGGIGAMPKDVLEIILSYLPRDAWPQDDSFCWHYECAMKQSALQLFGSKKKNTNAVTSKRKIQVPLTCKTCRVPRYCSQTCLTRDYKEMHKRICIEPPYCEIKQVHMDFCRSVQEGAFQSRQPPSKRDGVDELLIWAGLEPYGDDDEDGSWESMDTDDEEESDEAAAKQPQTLTQAVVKFMSKQRKKNAKPSSSL